MVMEGRTPVSKSEVPQLVINDHLAAAIGVSPSSFSFQFHLLVSKEPGTGQYQKRGCGGMSLHFCDAVRQSGLGQREPGNIQGILRTSCAVAL